MSEPPAEKRKLPVIKLALAGVILVVAAALVLRGVDLRAAGGRAIEFIRDRGPWVFFAAMAVLPAFGAPMMAFTIPAGSVFGPVLGMPAVIALALVAIGINLAISYWVSRYAFRPVVLWLVRRYGYSIPRITDRNALNILLIVRLTPGPPYALQCFVLGVAEAPFRLYLIVSWLALLPWALGAIVLGEGLFNGNFARAATGAGVLVVAIVAVQWARRRFARREN